MSDILPGYEFVFWDSESDPIDDIVQILRDYYGPSLTWDWCRYRFGSPNDHTIACMALHLGRAVGISAARIQDFTSNGSLLSATVSLATFVNPNHRGRGLYPNLLGQLELLATELGAAFQIALPNEMSRPSFAKAGYVKVGDSRERITPTGFKLPYRGMKSLGSASTFSSDPAVGDLPYGSFEPFGTSNDGSPYISSKLSSRFLSHRLSVERERCYTVDFFGATGVILMHGKRGQLRECKILATTKRILNADQASQLRREINRKYRPDLVTERYTSCESPKLCLDRVSVTRRANPPLFVNTTTKAPHDFDPRAIRLTGIDTHTW